MGPDVLTAVEQRRVAANGIEHNVALTGDGPPVVLLHGWPHTWRLWQDVIPGLARSHRVIGPDLRGTGDTDRPPTGYDVETLARDVEQLLGALGEDSADLVAIDAGAPGAFMLALRRPERVGRLVLMESLIGRLPGAEAFLGAGPPWWFGFHAVEGLAEEVLQGHEAAYVDWFLRSGTADGVGVRADVRDAFVEAYRGRDALRGGFEHYRAMGSNAALIDAAVAATRLTVPTLAIAGGVVGEGLHRQLLPVADDLAAARVDGCGHLVPLERPAELVALLDDFLGRRR